MHKCNVFTEQQETWLKALESGDYKQGIGALWQIIPTTDTKGYCCLGVATKLFEPESSLLEPETALRSCGVDLGVSLTEKLKLRSSSGHLAEPSADVGSSLVDWNDEGSTFAEIASFIRKNPWQVFTNFDSPTTKEQTNA
jgi:hypothetical protein